MQTSGLYNLSRAFELCVMATKTVHVDALHANLG